MKKLYIITYLIDGNNLRNTYQIEALSVLNAINNFIKTFDTEKRFTIIGVNKK